MYCGCNPTALSSQTQISEALTRLLAEKSYTKITVSELCRASGVSRQTFYSLFSSMENVPAGNGNAFLAGTALQKLQRIYLRKPGLFKNARGQQGGVSAV